MDKINIIERNKPYDSSTFKTKDRGICSTGVYTIETNKSFAEAAKALNTSDVTVRNRVLNNNFPNYQYASSDSS